MPRKNFDLDAFDLRLLELMQADARMPMPEVAERIGLSSPACYRRIRRLRRTGAIEREVALVKPRTLGWTLSMIVLVVLDREGNRTVNELMARIARHPQVLEIANVTGDYDFAIRLVARDMEDYGELAQKLFSNDERVRTFKTLVVIKEEKARQPLKAAGGD